MAGVRLDPDVVNRAAEEQLLAVAESIAERSADRYAMRELTRGRWAPCAEVRDGRVVVTTDFPFAHLDEWGGANVRSIPTGAMRSAAIEFGRFTPADKP